MPELIAPPVVSEEATPIKVDLANNKIVVNIPAHDPVAVPDRTGLEYFLEVWVPDTYLSNNYVLLDMLEGREAPKKTYGGADIYPGAFFEIDSLLRGVLESTGPDYKQEVISVCVGLITPYFCKAIVKNNGDIVSSATYTSRYAMKSGIAESDFEAYGANFFDLYIGAGKRFLTYKPDNLIVTKNQPEYLYFLTNYTKNISEIRLKCKKFGFDGNVLEWMPRKLENTSAMQVYCVPVGMSVLGIGDDVKKYSVWLENQNGDVISEVRTYVVDKKYRRFEKYLLFENSLGVFDVLVVGETETSKKVTKQSGEKFTGYDYLASASETLITERSAVKELKVSFGWSNKRVASYLTDFVYSRAIFLQTDRGFLAMECVTDTHSISDKNDYYGVSVSLRYSQKETNFSELPAIGSIVDRPTGWRALTTACQLDERGRRNGMTTVLTLEKYYLDNNSLFLPRTIKPNVVGKEGYLPPAATESCGFGSTPFLSAEISRQGTFVRQNCGAGLVGGYATIVVPAGAWGSTINQADADAKAEAEWQQLNTQAYANANGTCSPFPWAYVKPDIPAGRFWVRFQSSNQQATNNSGWSSGEVPYRPGNMWFCKPELQPNQTDVYAPNVWDVSYPVRTIWTFYVYNDNTPRTWKYYLNGVLKQTVAITGVNTTISLTELPQSGDRVFFSIE